MSTVVFTRIEIEYIRSMMFRNSAILPDIREEAIRISHKVKRVLDEHEDDNVFIIVGFNYQEETV